MSVKHAVLAGVIATMQATTISAQRFDNETVTGILKSRLTQNNKLPGDACHPFGVYTLGGKEIIPPCVSEQLLGYRCDNITGVTQGGQVSDEQWTAYKKCLIGEGGSFEDDLFGCLACKETHGLESKNRTRWFKSTYQKAFDNFKKDEVPKKVLWQYFQAVADWDGYNNLDAPKFTDEVVAKPVGEYYTRTTPQSVGKFTFKNVDYPEPLDAPKEEAKSSEEEAKKPTEEEAKKPTEEKAKPSEENAKPSAKEGETVEVQAFIGQVSQAKVKVEEPAEKKAEAAPDAPTSAKFANNRTAIAAPAADAAAGVTFKAMNFHRTTNVVFHFISKNTVSFGTYQGKPVPVAGTEKKTTKEEADKLPEAPPAVAALAAEPINKLQSVEATAPKFNTKISIDICLSVEAVSKLEKPRDGVVDADKVVARLPPGDFVAAGAPSAGSPSAGSPSAGSPQVNTASPGGIKAGYLSSPRSGSSPSPNTPNTSPASDNSPSSGNNSPSSGNNSPSSGAKGGNSTPAVTDEDADSCE